MMSPKLAAAILAASSALLPREPKPLSTWADENRRLSSEASAKRGDWSTFAYQREPLDCCGQSSPYEIVVLMWASQVGKTEMMLNKVAETVSENPGPMLVVQPTLSMAEAFSKERLSPMFRDMPILAGKVADAKGRDAGSTIYQRRFVGGQVSIVGSNSPAGLASRPIRDLLLDEVDRYEDSAGTEGDPAELAIARTTTFWNRKVIFSSSPTIKGKSRIAAAFAESDQRFFFVPCPHCGHEQRLVWPRVEWVDDDPETAFYRCAKCEQAIPHHLKARMVAGGRWIAANPKSKIAGFHISSLYSPWLRWSELVEQWQRAQGNPERLRSFINTRLAELWDDEATSAVTEEALLARRENYGPVLPAAVALVTAGVDVQADRVEVSFWGWGKGEESWLLAHMKLVGDPTGDQVWKDLDRELKREWKHPVVKSLRVRATCIDSGYLAQTVCQFAEERRGRAVWAIKGDEGPRPIWPRRETKANRGRVFVLGVDSAKSIFVGRLKVTEGAGRVHLPVADNIDIGYAEQLLSEFVRTEYRRGRPVRKWERRKGRRAEALDCALYAYGALCGLRAHGIYVEAEAAAIEAMAQVDNLQADRPVPMRTPSERAHERGGPVSSSWMKGFFG